MSELEKLRRDAHYYEVIYTQYRLPVFQHMRGLGMESAQFLDLFQDAVIVLYEKSKDPSFQLICSVKTYLISICRNQFFKQMKRNMEVTQVDGEKTTYTDWLSDQEEIQSKEGQLHLLDQALDEFSQSAAKCYELIYRFFYLKESFSLIAKVMSYSSAENAKHQKARCQKKLRELYQARR